MDASRLQHVQLSVDYVESCMLLSEEANWNQTREDWKLMLRSGCGFGRVDGSELVASALVLPFDRSIAWISMVLVKEDWRRKGLATVLMKKCVEYVDTLSLVPVLDATLDGSKLYEKLGFSGRMTISRYSLNHVPSNGRHDAVAFGRVKKLSDPNEVRAIDRDGFGVDRMFVLQDLVSRSGTTSCFSTNTDDEAVGYVTGRPGTNAYQIGPLVATNSPIAIDLTIEVLNQLGGTVYVDVPDLQLDYTTWLITNGFQKQRSFIRMSISESPLPGNVRKCFAIGGPELG